MASDGVVDQMGSETRMCYGKQRLEKFLAEHKEESAQKICDDLISTLSIYRGENAVLDDVTVFCFRPNWLWLQIASGSGLGMNNDLFAAEKQILEQAEQHLDAADLTPEAFAVLL